MKKKIFALVTLMITMSTLCACKTSLDPVEIDNPATTGTETSAVSTKNFNSEELRSIIVGAPDVFKIDVPEKYGKYGYWYFAFQISGGKESTAPESFRNIAAEDFYLCDPDKDAWYIKGYPFDNSVGNIHCRMSGTPYDYSWNLLTSEEEQRAIILKDAAITVTNIEGAVAPQYEGKTIEELTGDADDFIFKKFPAEPTAEVAAFFKEKYPTDKIIDDCPVPYDYYEMSKGETPKIAEISNAWVKTKYFGAEMPDSYTTDDFKTTYNLEEINKYYSDAGIEFVSFYSANGVGNVSENTAVVSTDFGGGDFISCPPNAKLAVVKYTLRTSTGSEVLVTDLLVFIPNMNADKTDVEWKLDYYMNGTYIDDVLYPDGYLGHEDVCAEFLIGARSLRLYTKDRVNTKQYI